MIGQASLGRKGVKLNTTPQMRPAGKMSSVDDGGAAQCMAPNGRPETPTEIKKYRKSVIHEPGKIVRHYGLADDTVPQSTSFGIKTVTPLDENVGNVMKNYPESELMQWRLDQQEGIYASSKREPLGKTLSRGHELPDGLGSEKPFGSYIDAVYKNKNPESKALIYPVDVKEEETLHIHEQYVKSHGDYAPGQQRNRHYDWGSVGLNPNEQVFGITDNNPQYRGVAKALNPELQEEHRIGATVVQKRLEDFKITNDDELGQCKNLGHGTGPEGGHVYGIPSRRFEEWGVRRLLKGSYSSEEQLPDPDLGKSLRTGFRNVQTERPLGAPTIRTDIVAPKTKSVADNQNYGNEPDANSLLYPAGGVERGVVDEDYLKPYSEEDLRAFYASTGIQMSEEMFQACYQQGAEVDQLGGLCCINTFQKVRTYLIAQNA